MIVIVFLIIHVSFAFLIMVLVNGYNFKMIPLIVVCSLLGACLFFSVLEVTHYSEAQYVVRSSELITYLSKQDDLPISAYKEIFYYNESLKEGKKSVLMKKKMEDYDYIEVAKK